MSPRAVRLTAIPLAILGAAWSVAYDVWTLLGSWLLLPVAVTFGVYCLLVWRAWRHRAWRLDARHGQYVADATPISGVFLIGSTSAVAEQVQSWLLQPTRSARLHALPHALAHSWVSLAIAVALGCAHAVANRPTVRLDRTGVRALLSWRTRRFVTWADLAPHGAVIDHPLLSDRLRLFVQSKPLTESSPIHIPLGGLNIDGRRLAAAINYYVANPGAVPDIGTAADFALLAGRTDPPPAAPTAISAPA